MTWNILAHSFTIHNKALHRTDWNYGREDPEQTQARYRLATEAILTRRPDAVLLQECEPAFLTVEMELNPRAQYLLDEYVAYCCFGADGNVPHLRQKPGCAVLLHRAGRLSRVQTIPVACVDGDASYGGQHYASVAVLCEPRSGGQVWLGCLHQRYEAPVHLPMARGGPRVRGAQLQALRKAMQDRSPCDAIVLGGDFNATCRAEDTEFIPMADLESCTWLGREMGRVQVLGSRPSLAPRALPTGLNPDMTTPVAIDHFYLSSGLAALRYDTGGTPQPPYRPPAGVRGRSVVEGASDHVWVQLWVGRWPPAEQPALERASAPPESGIWAFGAGGPAEGKKWAGYQPPTEPVEPSLRGRRIQMLLPKFGMGKGETAVIMGPSKSNKCWELDNNKAILKDQKGVSWKQI